MADDWEYANDDKDSDGFTNLEAYINSRGAMP